jgi:cyclophilin family peptidyl-prolyl cis-trans isomerase/HEAT repeat protein
VTRLLARRTVSLAVALLSAGRPEPVAAQDEATIEVLARVMAAEDARRFDDAAFRNALLQPDSSVRQFAALALARLRTPAALPLLTPLLLDPDTTVQAASAFAIGLLGAPEGVDPLIKRARASPLSWPLGVEIVSALARLGGVEAAGFLTETLSGGGLAAGDTNGVYVRQAAREAWRLGRLAPVQALLGFTSSQDDETRIGAVYSLARLKAPEAAPRLLDALHDPHPLVRQAAARGLIRSYADTAGLPSATVAELLTHEADDSNAGVQIQALRSLGTYHLASAAIRVTRLLDDLEPNVALQATQTLGEMPSPPAVPALERVLAAKGGLARRRAALLSLARVDPSAFLAVETPWRTSRDWKDRSVAAEAWTWVRPGGRPELLRDPDPRVVAAALGGWAERLEGADQAFVQTCREFLSSPDAAVRTVAANGLARAADPTDIPRLVEAVRAARRDSFPDAAIAALGGLVAIAGTSPAAARRVGGEALAVLPAPTDYQIRRWAETEWPAAASAWGPAFPLATGRTMEDYRGLVRQYLLGTSPDRNPTVTIEVEQAGVIKLELFGAQAPLTVANFLRLVDRHFFDGMRWHRVVPNFVAQTGDPRGDGWGGPGVVVRDEINRHRFNGYVAGMALSGPDTGGSQWFVTLSPQPHLDGAYTAFGRVTQGVPVLQRVTEDDVIRSVHR